MVRHTTKLGGGIGKGKVHSAVGSETKLGPIVHTKRPVLKTQKKTKEDHFTRETANQN